MSDAGDTFITVECPTKGEAFGHLIETVDIETAGVHLDSPTFASVDAAYTAWEDEFIAMQLLPEKDRKMKNFEWDHGTIQDET